MGLIVLDGAGSLVVHHQLDALGVGVVVESLDVEVGVRSHEVEHIFLFFANPVFPADVPAFDEKLVEAVVGGEVDVAAHVGVCGSVVAVGLHFGVVDGVEVNVLHLCVTPLAFAGDHLPPHAHVFSGVNPRSVVVGAGVVEVVDNVGGEDVGGRTEHYHAPGRGERRGDFGLGHFHAGGEPRLECHGSLVEVEVHGGIVDERGLVYVDVERVGIVAHEQRCLHSGGREGGG